MTPVEVLRAFFTNPPLKVAELKGPPKKERHELARLAAAEMGVALVLPQ